MTALLQQYPLNFVKLYGDSVETLRIYANYGCLGCPPCPVEFSYQIDSIITTTNPYCVTYIPDSIVTHYAPASIVSTVCNESKYEYGYNGQMKDNEWAGAGNHCDFKYRGYDPRIGRFNSVDPVAP